MSKPLQFESLTCLWDLHCPPLDQAGYALLGALAGAYSPSVVIRGIERIALFPPSPANERLAELRLVLKSWAQRGWVKPGQERQS